jgi:hypothetical protein
MENTTKNVPIRVPEDLNQRVKEKLLKEGGSVQSLVVSWLEEWASGERATPPVSRLPRDHQRWVDTLLLILRSGDRGCIQAVTSNLVQFERVIRLASKEIEKKSS